MLDGTSPIGEHKATLTAVGVYKVNAHVEYYSITASSMHLEWSESITEPTGKCNHRLQMRPFQTGYFEMPIFPRSEL